MGRSSKISKKIITAVSDAISQGATLAMAAGYAGISYYTLNNWTKAGTEIAEAVAGGGDEPKRGTNEALLLQFFNAIEDAKTEAGLRWQMVVNEAANRDPFWAIKMLQVRFPGDYRQPAQDLNLNVRDIDAAIERELAIMAGAGQSQVFGTLAGGESPQGNAVASGAGDAPDVPRATTGDPDR